MPAKKRIYADVDEELHHWLITYCARERITMRRLILSLVEALRDSEDVPGNEEDG